jgi:hypothetical protein
MSMMKKPTRPMTQYEEKTIESSSRPAMKATEARRALRAASREPAGMRKIRASPRSCCSWRSI